MVTNERDWLYLPPADVVRREGTVFTGVSVNRRGRVPQSLVPGLVPCTFMGQEGYASQACSQDGGTGVVQSAFKKHMYFFRWFKFIT